MCYWCKWILLLVFLMGNVVGCKSDVQPQSTVSPLRSPLTVPLGPSLAVPTPPVPELPQPTETAVERAIADLANRQGCSHTEIDIVVQEAIFWWMDVQPSDEFDCERLEVGGHGGMERVMIVTADGDRYEEYRQRKGKIYAGYRVLLECQGQEYVYYVSEQVLVQCRTN